MNLGGYTKSDFQESSGNDILKNFLHDENSIFTHFSEQDKTPNFDGYFELLEGKKNKSIPIGRFNVQIKTMDHDYTNKNKKYNISEYKYLCETKIFNAVKNGITLDPCILFMVDIQNKKIFYKYVSFEFAFALNINDEVKKTIYFNKEDELTSITSFYEEMKSIYFKKKQQLSSLENNKFSINEKLSKEEILTLQKEFDYINNIFDTDLLYIKNRFFPDVWKFGLSYIKNRNSLGMGIYYICKGKNDIYFKMLSHESIKECRYVTLSYNGMTNLHEMINKFIKGILQKSFEQNIISLDKVPKEVLFEVAFYFLDKVSSISKALENNNRPHTYYKDLESTDKLETYFSALVQYGAENGIETTEKINNINKLCLVCDPMEEICIGNNMDDLTKKRKRLGYLFTHPNEINKVSDIIILSGNFEYYLVKNTIDELKKRNISNVERVWKSKNLNLLKKQSKELKKDRIENGYTVKDYFDNIRKLVKILPYSYNCYVRNLKNLDINGKYVYLFSNDEKWEITILHFDSEKFITEVNEKVLYDRSNIMDLVKNTKAKSATVSYRCYIFNQHFPLLTQINYLFIKQISIKYNITNLNLNKMDILLTQKNDNE